MTVNVGNKMKKLLAIYTLALAFVVAGIEVSGQAVVGSNAASQTNAGVAAQSRAVGEVTAVDAATRRISLRMDDGQVVAVTADEKTATLRLPPGEATAEKAEKIAFENIAVGERLFARGQFSADGKTLAARQLVVTSKATAQAQGGNREEWARRGINGRITSVNPQSKELVVAARSREGAQDLTVSAAGNVRILRYAPDSANVSDARPISFADLKVGDQIRALGERSADGARFTPEEIVAGSFTRAGGTITAVNATGDEITVKNTQTGETLTIVFGRKSNLRRVTPEAAASFAQRGEQRRRERGAAGSVGNGGDGAAAATASTPAGQGRAADGAADREARRAARGERPRGGGGGMGGGRNLQELLGSLPTITPAELKKGDAVFIVGTKGDSPTRLTAITLLTGDADFLNRLQRMQGRPGRDGRDVNPGLPGDVLGGGERREP